MRSSILFAFISALVVTLSGMSVQAQRICALAHLDTSIFSLKAWPTIQGRYSKSVQGLTPSQQRDQKVVYDAVFFFDHIHTQEIFSETISKGKKLDVPDLIRRYGDRKFFFTDKFEGPFANFVKTNEWLSSERPEVSIETFKEINRRMLEGRVLLRLTDLQKGNFREVSVAGNLRIVKVTEEKAKNYSQNIYLDYQTHAIMFSTILIPRPLAMERIRIQNPTLALEIEKFHESKKDENDPSYALLERRAIHSLVKERFDWFHSERKKLGLITDANVNPYLELVAEFQRDLVSIHPFWDGNGRTTRVLMNYLLTKENLPPARLTDPDVDLNGSLKDWQAAVKKGLLNTVELTDNFALRNELALPVFRSEQLITPLEVPEALSRASSN